MYGSNIYAVYTGYGEVYKNDCQPIFLKKQGNY